MSSLLKSDSYCSPEEYLAAERVAEQKHEYLAGVIYAMAGTTVRHNRIADNIRRHLGNQLSRGPCEAFSSDIKVPIKIRTAKFYYYPDVTVDCSKPPDESYFSEEPKVIFEVLSPQTERIDRGEKLQNYQSLPSLQAYVLVDQSKLAVTIYRRAADSWDIEFLNQRDDVLRLAEIECELPLSAIYERTDILA